MAEEIGNNFSELLKEFAHRRFNRKRIGGQYLANAIQQQFKDISIPRTTIDNWLKGEVAAPRDWWEVAVIASVVCSNRRDANQLLQITGHMTLEDRQHSGALNREERLVLEWWEEFSSDTISKPHTITMPLLADYFQGNSLDLTIWNKGQTQYNAVHDGKLWFDIPVNTDIDWYADILEPRLAHNNYFTRIELTVRLDFLPNQSIGYIGLQVDCDRGWLLVYLGETDPKLVVEYSQDAEHHNYRGKVRQRLVPISFGRDYKIALTWKHNDTIIMMDDELCCIAPCVPSRYFNLNAGVDPGMAVRGTISKLRVWD